MLTSSRLPVFLAGLLALTTASGPRRTATAADAHGDPLPQRAKIRIGTTRFRHGDTVTAAAFSPDGQTVATASRDGTLSLWETESGKERVRFRGHAGAVLVAAFTRSGERLISGGVDGTVRCWRVPRRPWTGDLLAGEETRCFRLLRAKVQAVALSADGSTAAAGTADGVLVVWDLNSDKQRHRFTQEGQVYCLALSAEGRQLAANQAACGAVLWDTAKGEVRHRLDAGVIASLTFSPDGHTLAVGYQHDRLVLWDTRRGIEKRVLYCGKHSLAGQAYGVLSVCYSADGRQVATGGTDNSVYVWDAETGRQMSVVKGHGDNVTAVAFDGDGKRVISGGADNTVRVWDAATGRSLAPEREPAMPLTSVSLSPGGRMLALLSSPNHLAVWDTSVGRRLTLPDPLNGGLASAASFRPLGQTLAVAGADGGLRFCDLATRIVLSAERESPRRWNDSSGVATEIRWPPMGRTITSISGIPARPNCFNIWDYKRRLISL